MTLDLLADLLNVSGATLSLKYTNGEYTARLDMPNFQTMGSSYSLEKAIRMALSLVNVIPPTKGTQ